MQQNVAGQNIAAQMVTAADGSPFTGVVSVFVDIDNAGQVAGAGTVSHSGNGSHNYEPTQAETNGLHIAFVFTNASAINATIQVYTNTPQTGDSFARLGAPAGASVSADIAVIDANVDSVLVDTGTDIPASLATIDTNVDAILVDTSTTIPAQIGSLNDFDPATDTVANVTLVDTTTTNTDMRGTDGANTIAPDNAGINANGVAIANLNDLSEAQVNAEFLDVLTVDTFSELVSVPSATSTILDKISWTFSMARNKLEQTATTSTLRNDADSLDIATSAVSDDGTTFTRNEWA